MRVFIIILCFLFLSCATTSKQVEKKLSKDELYGVCMEDMSREKFSKKSKDIFCQCMVINTEPLYTADKLTMDIVQMIIMHCGQFLVEEKEI